MADKPKRITDIGAPHYSKFLPPVIEKNYGINQHPEFFCFGLLESFDVCEIAALTVPREITFVDADDRAKQELAPLKAWYAARGHEFDPVE